jgi:predicted HAD superfamily phosphohydrolase YqeG
MPAPPDWMTTTWQTLPRFFPLLGKLQPTVHLPDISAVDAAFLQRHGVRALLWDVDGTLMPHHEREVAGRFQTALTALSGRVPQAVLSNCGEERLAELGQIFPSLPVLKAYRRADGTPVLRSLIAGQERWTVRGGAALPGRPAGRLTALKKPSAALIDLALDHLGVRDRDGAFMVGDQYFTDIAGANLAGIRSVKVPTFGRGSFPLAIRLFQLVERSLYRLLYGRPPAA